MSEAGGAGWTHMNSLGWDGPWAQGSALLCWRGSPLGGGAGRASPC